MTDNVLAHFTLASQFFPDLLLDIEFALPHDFIVEPSQIESLSQLLENNDGEWFQTIPIGREADISDWITFLVNALTHEFHQPEKGLFLSISELETGTPIVKTSLIQDHQALIDNIEDVMYFT